MHYYVVTWQNCHWGFCDTLLSPSPSTAGPNPRRRSTHLKSNLQRESPEIYYPWLRICKRVRLHFSHILSGTQLPWRCKGVPCSTDSTRWRGCVTRVQSAWSCRTWSSWTVRACGRGFGLDGALCEIRPRRASVVHRTEFRMSCRMKWSEYLQCGRHSGNTRQGWSLEYRVVGNDTGG